MLLVANATYISKSTQATYNAVGKGLVGQPGLHPTELLIGVQGERGPLRQTAVPDHLASLVADDFL